MSDEEEPSAEVLFNTTEVRLIVPSLSKRVSLFFNVTLLKLNVWSLATFTPLLKFKSKVWPFP